MQPMQPKITNEDHKMKPEDITDELKGKIKANIHKSWF